MIQHTAPIRGSLYVPVVQPRVRFGEGNQENPFKNEVTTVEAAAPKKKLNKNNFFSWLTMLVTAITGGSGYVHLNNQIQHAQQTNQSLQSKLDSMNNSVEKQLDNLNGKLASNGDQLQLTQAQLDQARNLIEKARNDNAFLGSKVDMLTGKTSLDDLVSLVARVAPANVRVETKLEGGHGAIGSGTWIQGKDGKLYILTNHHVIDEAITEPGRFEPTFKIRLYNGSEIKQAKTVEAHVVRTQNGKKADSESHDMALLEVISPGFELPKNVQPLKLRDINTDPLKQGEFVIVVGNPVGLNDNVTFGVISHVERQDGGFEPDNIFIGVDAPINPGNSGGALYDLQGRFIGINTAGIRGADGLGFTIRTDIVKDVLKGWGVID